MTDAINVTVGKLSFRLTIQSVLNFYLVWFLSVDVLNGLFLKIMDLGEAISFGQFARLAVFVLLNLYFFQKNKKFAHYISLAYLYFGFCLFSYWAVNDFEHDFILKEVIHFSKVLTYPLIFLYVHQSVHDERTIHRMVDVTFWIFAASISLTFLTGSGLAGYDQYAASKGFFYANNATAILGLSVGIYYLFYSKRIVYSILVLVVLYMSGSKVFLVFGGLIAYHFMLDFFKGVKSTKSSVFLYAIIFVLLAIGSGLVYQKIWVERYKVRVESVYINAERAGLFKNMDFFSYYAFISYDRAVNSKEAILEMNRNKEHYLTGLGYYYTKYAIFSDSKFGKDDIESDFFDMLIMYGLIGLSLFLVFHIVIIFKVERSIMPLALMVLLYAVVAGHLVYNPMSYTLPAALFGFYFREKSKNVLVDKIS